MPKCFLVVRAIVADPAKRSAFDAWYREAHLPEAMQVFGAEKGWRFWSVTDPAAHQATYQFADNAAAERALNSAGMTSLIAEFDRAWPGVPRTREVLALAQERSTTLEAALRTAAVLVFPQGRPPVTPRFQGGCAAPVSIGAPSR